MISRIAPSPTLRAGDLVTVRSKEEILATLDADGKLERLPFMPEMLDFCGKEFRVAAVAHKTCDPAHNTGGRRLANAVHLADLRCDGSAHGGCQASCLLFWKTAWLRVSGTTHDASRAEGDRISEEYLRATTQRNMPNSPAPRYSCQATCLFAATEPLAWWNLGQYYRDLTSRNVTGSRFARTLVVSWVRALGGLLKGSRIGRRLYAFFHRLLLGRPAPAWDGGMVPAGTRTPVRELNLQAGDRVRVKSNHEILETLDANNKNRGLWFDDEATVFCGNQFEVEQRIDRIINEVTGEMTYMKTPSVTLRGVRCQSIYSRSRLFCPRAITPYWREAWLDPVDDGTREPR